MSNKKIDCFNETVDKAGLTRAYEKISVLASKHLDCYLEDIIEGFVADCERPECRIRYCEKDQDGHECFIFETRQSSDEEFGFCVSFRLIDDRLSYQALTKIREMTKLGYSIWFG